MVQTLKMLNIRLIGVEPITFGTEIQRSIQLSYKRFKKSKMIQQESILKVIDNSGAKTVKCIKVLGGFRKRYAKLGDIIVVSIQELRNRSKKTSKVLKGNVFRALLLKVKSKYLKKDGTFFTLKENAVALITKQGSPVGTRILTSLPRKLRKKKFLKFISLSVGLF